MTSRRVPLKDQRFNQDNVTCVATRIERAYSAFARRRFADEVRGRLGELGLEQR